MIEESKFEKEEFGYANINRMISLSGVEHKNNQMISSGGQRRESLCQMSNQGSSSKSFDRLIEYNHRDEQIKSLNSPNCPRVFYDEEERLKIYGQISQDNNIHSLQ